MEDEGEHIKGLCESMMETRITFLDYGNDQVLVDTLEKLQRPFFEKLKSSPEGSDDDARKSSSSNFNNFLDIRYTYALVVYDKMANAFKNPKHNEEKALSLCWLKDGKLQKIPLSKIPELTQQYNMIKEELLNNIFQVAENLTPTSPALEREEVKFGHPALDAIGQYFDQLIRPDKIKNAREYLKKVTDLTQPFLYKTPLYYAINQQLTELVEDFLNHPSLTHLTTLNLHDLGSPFQHLLGDKTVTGLTRESANPLDFALNKNNPILFYILVTRFPDLLKTVRWEYLVKVGDKSDVWIDLMEKCVKQDPSIHPKVVAYFRGNDAFPNLKKAYTTFQIAETRVDYSDQYLERLSRIKTEIQNQSKRKKIAIIASLIGLLLPIISHIIIALWYLQGKKDIVKLQLNARDFQNFKNHSQANFDLAKRNSLKNPDKTLPSGNVSQRKLIELSPDKNTVSLFFASTKQAKAFQQKVKIWENTVGHNITIK